MSARRIFELGGIAAGIVLIVFGVVAIAMGFNARTEVRDGIARENIVGTPDSSIAGQKVTTGAEAKIFADTIRKHALEITGGQTYAEMGRFLDPNGNPTSDEAAAAKDPKTGAPVENGLRNVWVTATALTTALTMSYMAEQLALFSIVVGFALLLAGIGFLVLALGGALRHRERTVAAPAAPAKPVPAA